MNDLIGAMRARIRLQQPARVADEIGGAAITWIDAGDVWASITADAASAAPNFDAAPSSTTLRVAINRRGDVRSGWRVLWGARLFRVNAVRDEGRARIELVCGEEVL